MPRRQFLKVSAPRLQTLSRAIQDPAVQQWANEVVRTITNLDDLPTLSARVYRTADQALGATAAVHFTAVRYNNGGLWDTSNPTRLTAVQSGLYTVSFHATLSAGADFFLRVNGTDQITPDDTSDTVTIETKWYFAQDDYVQAYNAGGAVTVNAVASYSPEFSMHWLAPQQE